MIELSVFALGLGLMMLAWKFVYKPSALGLARDVLNDLQDEAAEAFKAHPFGTSHAAYQEIRSILASQAMHLDKMSLFKFFRHLRLISKHQELVNEIRENDQKKFASCDQQMYSAISKVRTKAFHVVVLYLAATSLVGIVMIAIAAFIALLDQIKEYLKERLSGALHEKQKQWRPFVAATVMCVTSIVGMNNVLCTRTVVEDWGMHQS